MAKNEMVEDLDAVLQVRKLGNSLGLILPRELLARLRLKEGDKLHVVEQTERGLDIARQAFREYADTFRALAK